MLLGLCAREPQDATDDLLDSRRRASFLEAAKHIGKGAVPALAQFLDGENEAHSAFRRSDVCDAFQLFQPAHGNLHLVFRDIEFLHEPVAQWFAVVHTLRLDEQDRPEIFSSRLPLRHGQHFQARAQADRLRQQLIALARMPAENAQRQLHHLRRVQFRRRHPMQDVRRRIRLLLSGSGFQLSARWRRRELDNARRLHRAQRRKGKLRPRIVRLVHDDDGAAHPQHIDEGIFRLPVRSLFERGEQRRGLPLEMLRHVPILAVIDLAPGRVVRAEGLNRRDDHDCLPLHIPALEQQRFFDAFHLYGSARLLEGLIIRMALFDKCVPRLVENRVTRHQPQHHGTVGVHELPHRQSRRMAGEQRLSPARRHPQADVGHRCWQSAGGGGQVRNRREIVAPPHIAECLFRSPVFRRLAEEFTERIEHPRLVVLEGNHVALIS